MKYIVFDSFEETTKINYSVDVQEMLDAKQITKRHLYEYIDRMSKRDFGSVDEKTSWRFHLLEGDKDLYGIFDNIVVYYDAAFDEIDILTKSEFNSYVKADWKNPSRTRRGEGQATRISTKEPMRQVKQGQQSSIIQTATEEYGANTPGLEGYIRRGEGTGLRTYPYTDYTSLAKALETKFPEIWQELKTLSKAHNVPMKKILFAFGTRYRADNYSVPQAFAWIKKHIDDPYTFTTDSAIIAPEYEVIELYKDDEYDITYAILYNPRLKEYAAAERYDPKTGKYDIIHLGFKAPELAHDYLQTERIPDANLIRIEKTVEDASLEEKIDELAKNFTAPTFINKTSQGYRVERIYRDEESNRLYAIIYRPKTNDFMVAAGYNVDDGTWDQGYYDYSTYRDAWDALSDRYSYRGLRLHWSRM